MKRMLMLICLAVFAAGCAGMGASPTTARKVSYPNAATPELTQRFNAADELYRSKRFAEADAAFASFIAGFPYTELTDEARFRRGEIAFARKDYGAAAGFYREAVAQIESPRVGPKARFKGALALSKLSRPQEAADELAKIYRGDASAVLRLRIDSLGVRASKAAGIAPNAAIVWNLRLLDDYAESQGTAPTGIPADELVSEDAALKEVRRWVSDSAVTTAEVEALPMKEMRGRRSGGFAAYKLALIAHSTGDLGAAKRQLKAYISAYPKHENYGAARLLLGELGGAVGEGEGVTVGVLLPLSGKYAVYGESTLHGIECAVGVYEPCVGPAGMRLVIRDSEATTGGVIGAVDELAAENVVAIVGPLMSATAPEAARRAQELGIPMISVSQREGIAEVGDYVFRNSVSDVSEMATLADYAVNKLRLHRFFVIYPPSKKGSEYRGLFTEAVRTLGGTVVGAQSFSPTEGRVVDELRGRFLAEQQMASAEEGAAPEPMIDLSTTGDFDALFVADSVGVGAYISGRMSLSAAGSARHYKLLGISRWDDQKLVDRAGNGVAGAIFADSFFKGAPDESVSTFVTRFQQAYDTAPTMLEALGYDSMRILISAVQEKGAVRRDSIREALARTVNFPGVTGKTSFDEQGNAKKEMWVLTIADGQIQPAK